MYGKKYRAQILLEPEQAKALAAIARQEGRSLSDLMRDIVAQYLAGRGAPEAGAARKLMQIREILGNYSTEAKND